MKYSKMICDMCDQFDFRSNFLFDGLTPAQSNRIQNLFEPINFQKESKLFYENGIPTGVFLVERGLVKKSKVTAGREQILYIYTQGDLLGHHALLSNERYQHCCEALKHSKVNFLSSSNFFRLLEDVPMLKNSLISNLSHEFGVMANAISLFAQKTQNTRLALFLLVLESRYKKFKPDFDGIGIARQDLANLIGATRESLGRSLKEFKDRGLLTIESKAIHIQNHEMLFEMLSDNNVTTKKPLS